MTVEINPDLHRASTPAPIVRLFGWSMLAVLAAFAINNALIVGWGMPGAMAVLSGGGGIVNLAIYVVLIALAAFYVLGTSTRALRLDAMRIHNFNAYLIRAAFWVVLLVGLADAAVALGRVEDLLVGIVGEEIASNLGRASYVGTYVHIPLIIAGMVIGLFTRTLGFPWLALMIVAAELAIVLS